VAREQGRDAAGVIIELDAGICAVVSKAQGWNLLKSIEIAVTQSHSPIQ
jgi:hypothetical protein